MPRKWFLDFNPWPNNQNLNPQKVCAHNTNKHQFKGCCRPTEIFNQCQDIMKSFLCSFTSKARHYNAEKMIFTGNMQQIFCLIPNVVIFGSVISDELWKITVCSVTAAICDEDLHLGRCSFKELSQTLGLAKRSWPKRSMFCFMLGVVAERANIGVSQQAARRVGPLAGATVLNYSTRVILPADSSLTARWPTRWPAIGHRGGVLCILLDCCWWAKHPKTKGFQLRPWQWAWCSILVSWDHSHHFFIVCVKINL